MRCSNTQRSLYNLALFNEVNTAVQNPNGEAPQKNVLVQLTEAKRWDLIYGFGFEAATGTPNEGQISTASKIQLGLPVNQTYIAEWNHRRKPSGVARRLAPQPVRHG